jgi:hypothetical protein
MAGSEAIRARAYADGIALGVEGGLCRRHSPRRMAYPSHFGHLYADGYALGVWGPDFFLCADLLVPQHKMHINIYKNIYAIHRNLLQVPYTAVGT